MRAKRRSDDTIGRGFRQAIEWSLVALAAAVLVVSVVLPRIAGATPYTVLTGSMRPTMPPGTLVVVRHVDPTSLSIGDVVTFQPTKGSTEVITHRVVATGVDAAGQRVLRTRGDANAAADPALVHGYQIVGARWYDVPYVGYLTRLLTGEQRTIGVRIAIAALLLYALAMFLGEWRDRFRHRHRDRHREPGHLGERHGLA